MLLVLVSAVGLVLGVDFGIEIAPWRLVGLSWALEALEDFLTSIGLEERKTAGADF